MKCPHCKKNIRVNVSKGNPVVAGRRGKDPTGRRSVSLRKNAGGRPQYRAKFGNRQRDFYAQNDDAAIRYANGLLAGQMGRKPSSLQRTGKREPKT